MTRKSKWRGMHRSLAGQTTLLVLALLLVAVGYFAFLPMLSWTDRDPLETTSGFIFGAVFNVANQPEVPVAAIRDAAVVREASAQNSDFRLYVRRGDQEMQIGSAPRWQEAINFDYSQLAPGKRDEQGRCYDAASSSAKFNEQPRSASVYYKVCDGEEFYVELGGIEFPVERAMSKLSGLNPIAVWWISRDFLMVGAAILALVLVLLIALARSLRRVARVAQSFDPRELNHALPEKGLPSEVLPLVHAINRMIQRIDQANEEQSFFLAAAAHELRTPLAVVRIRLEELPAGPEKEQLKGDVRRMASLVDQLLRLITVRNQGQPDSAVDLVSMARQLVAERAPLVINQGVDIDLEARASQVEVRGDERLLKVALGNLVDNALSFSKPGQRLEVRVEPNKRVTVRDQGPGIPPEALEEIFRPFAKNPPNRRGHGLGLAIVQSIMHLHGGGVSASNREGGGAAFALEF